jgi:hypothetical protein
MTETILTLPEPAYFLCYHARARSGPVKTTLRSLWNSVWISSSLFLHINMSCVHILYFPFLPLLSTSPQTDSRVNTSTSGMFDSLAHSLPHHARIPALTETWSTVWMLLPECVPVLTETWPTVWMLLPESIPDLSLCWPRPELQWVCSCQNVSCPIVWTSLQT